MTLQQLEQIATLRQNNYSYSFIGNVLDISPNTIKSICRRKGFEALGARKTKLEKETATLCKNCHKPLPEHIRKDAIFCSDFCRTKWRRKNFKVISK